MDRPVIPTLPDTALAQGLAQKLAGRRFPLAGQWELTCRCNLRCLMCYTDCFNTSDMIRQELSLPEILRIMDEVQEEGCLELSLTGGEPLARRDFLDIYTYAQEAGFLVTVLTNGTLITEAIANHWVRYPPSMIEISFHGFTRESFERITQGPGSYERCLEGIRLILERNLPLTLKTTAMTVNRGEVLKIKEYVARLGHGHTRHVQYKFGSDIRPRLDGSEDVFQYQLRPQEVRAIEQADAEFRAERARQDRHEEELLREEKDRCGSGRYKFHIDAYGQLQLCSGNRRQSYDLRRGSFHEGFYQFLPQFPCPYRQPLGQQELLSIQSLAPRGRAMEVA